LKSENLYHFTKTIEVLESILLNGFYPRYCLEDVRWMGKGQAMMAFPIVCFSDIPIDESQAHRGQYGGYGLELTKEWGFKNNINPVIYSADVGPAMSMVNFLIDSDMRDVMKPGDLKSEYYSHAYQLNALIKPIQGVMMVGGYLEQKEFYKESEWRYVANGCTLITQLNYGQTKDDADKEMESQKLVFLPTDIEHIFVENNADKPRIENYIRANPINCADEEIEMLVSRIVVLDKINE